jgi:hypothetical protein
MDSRIKADMEMVHPPPRRPDAAGCGNPMEVAVTEAHEREGQNEAATTRELTDQKVASTPPDDGEAGSWQPE